MLQIWLISLYITLLGFDIFYITLKSTQFNNEKLFEAVYQFNFSMSTSKLY